MKIYVGRRTRCQEAMVQVPWDKALALDEVLAGELPVAEGEWGVLCPAQVRLASASARLAARLCLIKGGLPATR